MMKKQILLAATVIFSIAVYGQSYSHNALRLGQNPYVATAALFSQTFYEGSARTSAMGNAFISLGGDVGALSINPASSGVYKYSEFSVTPSMVFAPSKTEYLSTSMSDLRNKPTLSSMGYISNLSSLNRGRNSSLSISFAVNRINDFNSRFSAKGTTAGSSWLGSVASGTNGTASSELDVTFEGDTYPYNIGLPWRNVLAWNSTLLDLLPGTNNEYIAATENLDGDYISIGGPLNQSFTRETMGNQTEILVYIGGRIETKLFLGANIGIQALSYTDYQRYKESAQNPANFQTGFKYMDHTFRQSTNGIGLNAKLGVIFLPVAGLRLGATLTTPTIMSLTESWEEQMTSSITGLNPETMTLLSPLGEYSFGMVSPLKLGAGISYVFGRFAIISADVEGVAYNTTRLVKSENGNNAFTNENDDISKDFRFAKNIRLGAEVKPFKNIALRAGYSYYQNAEKSNPNDFSFISAGAGFNSNGGFFLDLSFQHRVAIKERLKLYQDYSGVGAPEGFLTSSANKLYVTFGFRF